MSRNLPRSSDSLDEINVFSQIKLIALDIDGTLLEKSDSEVAEVIAGMNTSLRHHRRDVRIMVATGRAFAGARPVIEGLGLRHGVPVILYNGAVIGSADGSRVSRLFELTSSQIRQIGDLAVSEGFTAFAYDVEEPFPLEGLFSLGNHMFVESVTGFSSAPTSSTEFNGLEVLWNPPMNESPNKAVAMLIDTNGRPSRSMAAKLTRVPGITLTSSVGTYIEIRPAGANKGTALSVVASELSLSRDQVLAIGDNDNDVEMLEWAGCSVCVANSTTAAREASDFESKGSASVGVVEILRVVFDARRHRYR